MEIYAVKFVKFYIRQLQANREILQKITTGSENNRRKRLQLAATKIHAT